MHNLSHYKYDQGYYAEAEKTQRPAVAIFEAVYGLDHLNTSSAKRLLGKILCDSGQFDEAEVFLKEALRIRKIHLSENHDNIIILQAELDECQRLKGL